MEQADLDSGEIIRLSWGNEMADQRRSVGFESAFVEASTQIEQNDYAYVLIRLCKWRLNLNTSAFEKCNYNIASRVSVIVLMAHSYRNNRY